MTWSQDGTTWIVEHRPWTDEFEWSDVVRRAHLIRDVQQRRRGDLVACQTCRDATLLSTNESGSWVSIFCPECRPEEYRRMVESDEWDWSTSTHGNRQTRA